MFLLTFELFERGLYCVTLSYRLQQFLNHNSVMDARITAADGRDRSRQVPPLHADSHCYGTLTDLGFISM